jgi:cytochrome P450
MSGNSESENTSLFGFFPRDRDELHAFLADLRENKPVHRIPPQGIWAITRYDDVVHVLNHPEIFSSEAIRYLATGLPDKETRNQPEIETNLSSENASLLFRATPTVINTDPPDHSHYRNIVNRGFTPKQIKRLEPRIQEITDGLLDEVVGKGEIELMQDLAIPLPVTVIAELLGVDAERGDDFKRWSDLFLSTIAQSPDAKAQQQLENAMVEFADYFREVIKERRATPKDDLISIITHADTPEGSLSDVEILAFCRTLLVAGNETTTTLVARMVFTLLDHPDEFAKLRADLSLLPNAIEETLRYAGIVPTLPRLTTQDTEIAGVKIPARQLVLPFFMAANRDPRRFPDPERFDITRKTTGHLGFGFGIHFCLGAHLARLETRIAMEGIIRRLPNLRLVDPDQKFLVVPGGPVTVHLKFDASARRPGVSAAG